MKNKTLITAARKILKKLLIECTAEQHLMFKRMYCPKNTNLTINDTIDQMEVDKIDWAITQVEKTIAKNNK